MRQRLLLLAASTAYAWVLSWTYVERVSPIWAYEGSRYAPPPAGVEPIGWGLALLPGVWLPMSVRRPSQVVYWFLYAIVYVPTCLLAMFSVTIEPAALVTFLICLALCFGGLGLIYRLPLLDLPTLPVSRSVFWLGLASFSLVCYGLILSIAGLRASLVGLEDVYSLRADYTTVIERSGPALVYAVSWQVGLVNPLLVAYGVFHKNPLAVLVGVLLELVVYSITGFKTALFTGFVLVAIAVCLRRTGRYFGLMVLGGLVSILAVAPIVDQLTDSNLWTGILVNRSLAMPGLLTGYYFEFFSRNPQALLSDSILRPFVTYPYALQIPPLVGNAYLNGAWANANVWADAYANFGYVGLVAFTALLAAVLYVFDTAAVGHDQRFPAVLGASMGWTLANGALLTSLLTNGIGWLILAVYLLPRARPGEDRLLESVSAVETPRFRWFWSDWPTARVRSPR